MLENFKTKFLVLLGLCFFSFLGVFFRQDLFGFDSYASWLCVKGNCDVLGFQQGAVFLFGLMPDSLLFFKAVMFTSFFVSILILWFLVKKFFSERTAWYSIIFLLASTPWMLFEFAKFENELFAFPLIFLGLYFLFSKKWYFFIPLLGSLLFWLWPGYFFVFPGSVLELQLFSGLSTLFIGLFFVFPFFLIKNKWFSFLGIVFLVFGLWSSHLIVFVIPLVVLGIAQLIELIEI